MSRKHTAKEFDKSNKWLVIGVDLAKYDNTIVGITEDGEVQIIERISTADLLELASEIQQTTFAMEPCNGANILSLNLQAKGHEVKMISGAAVKDWVKVHLAGQKTDRNDALALAHLSRDTMLKPIRTKTVTEMRMQSIYAARKQLVKCRTSILVSLKGMSQAWGIIFSAQRRNLKKMKESLENKVELLSQPVVDALIQMIDSVARLDKEIEALESVMKDQLSQDERAQRIQSTLGIGFVGTHRLLSTCGDPNRFKGPKSFAAYYGLVPNNKSTGHNYRVGKCSCHGDAEMRSCLYQAAAVLYMQNVKHMLPECALKQWIDKKVSQKMMWGKMIIALAAKLARILWALLKYDAYFNLSKAGLSRSMLAQQTN